MSELKRPQPSALVLALLAPLALTACGTAVKAPAAATGTASSSQSQPIGAVSDPVAGTISTVTTTAGNTAGSAGSTLLDAVGSQVTSAGGSLPAPASTVVEGVGNSVTAAGNSLSNGALDNPAGVTVLDSTVTDTTSKDLVDASVISNTPASNAPVQANVIANGQIASADVTNNPDVPVVSPLLAGAQTTLDNATGTDSTTPLNIQTLSSPSAASTALGQDLEQVGGGIGSSAVAVSGPGGEALTQVAGLTSMVGSQFVSAGGSLSTIPGLSTATGQLSTATAPLDPLLDVSVANNQLIGTSTGGAAVTLDVDSAGQLAYADTTTPAGVPNPVDTLVSTVDAPTSPLYTITAPLNAPTTSITNPADGGISSAGNASTITSSNPLTGLTSTLSGAAGGSNPVSSVTSTLTGATSGSNPVTPLTSTLTSATGSTPLSSVTSTLSGATGSNPTSTLTSTLSSATGSAGTSGLTSTVTGLTSTVTKALP